MSECSAAGYTDSSLTPGWFWATRLRAGESCPSEEEEEEVEVEEEESRAVEREAKSSSPAERSLVILHNNWPPGKTTQAAVMTGNYDQLSVMVVVLNTELLE